MSWKTIPDIIIGITGKLSPLSIPSITLEKIATMIDKTPAPTVLNFAYGTQVINMPRTAQYNVLDIRGRTLINLLGRVGNCEDATKHHIGLGGMPTLSNVTSPKTQGANSTKIVLTSPGGSAYPKSDIMIIPTAANECYIVIADFYNESTTGVSVIYEGNIPMEISKIGSTVQGSWQKIAMKLRTTEIPAASTFWRPRFDLTGESNSVAYMDAIRIFKISQADYNAISFTAQGLLEIETKYPYVDDMKPITNPYAIKKGENLFPPFAEWHGIEAGTPLSIYQAEMIVSDGSSKTINHDFYNLTKGQTYTISADVLPVNSSVALEFFTTEIGIYSATPILRSATTPFQFTVPLDTNIIRIHFGNEQAVAPFSGTNGTFIFTNPMLNLGTTALPFTPNHDQYLVLPTQLASNADGTVHDQINRRGTEYYKLNRLGTMDLTGNLPWTDAGNLLGSRIVKLSTSGLIRPFIDFSESVIKYDGKPLESHTGINGPTAIDVSTLRNSDSGLFIAIDNLDSGWGEDYMPTDAEIQAYFYGWKMYQGETHDTDGLGTYDGTGTKKWVALDKSITVIAGTGTTTLPTSPLAGRVNWKPYKLQYQLATPTEEQILPEGDITLHEGLNQIEVGNGMIVRERANPSSDAGNTIIGMDYTKYSGTPGNTATKYRTERIVAVYKDNRKDNWIIGEQIYAYGKQRAYKSNVDFDPTGAYTITYIAEAYSLTCSVQSIEGEYTTNQKMTLDNAVKTQSDLITRVSVLETQKTDKAQPQWIDLIPLNGWIISRAFQYRVTELGYLEFRGIISSGIVTVGTIIARYPLSAVPKRNQSLNVLSYNGVNDTMQIAVDIYSGIMTIPFSSRGNILFDGVSVPME
jgi:hypothetical protein